MLESLLDDRRFTVVVPLAVVSDLDVKQGQGDTAAVDALSFLETSVPAHALYLKVQTSKGNYLQDLRFRSEDHTGQQRHDTITLVRVSDLAQGQDSSIFWQVLQVAQWHLDHFVNRTNLINPTASEAPPQDALKVALLTLNQKFRQKARSSKIEALNDSELLDLVAKLPDG